MWHMSWTPVPQAEMPEILRLEANTRAAAQVNLFNTPGIVGTCALCGQHSSSDIQDLLTHLFDQ